jgi:hypothetical protein
MWAESFRKRSQREADNVSTFKKLDKDHSGTLSLKEANLGIAGWAKANGVTVSKD